MVFNSQDINIIADMEGTTGVKLHNNKQKLRNRFDIVRKLGQGTYGKVQLAVNKDTGEEVAIKTIRKSKIESESDLVRIQREIQIMSSVQHPHIIHIYEVFENKEKIVLVMEYASGGELYDYLSYKKFLEEHEARRVFRQVVAAVYYCHKNMICHRDLKLENILLDEKGNAKIADFGLSNIFNEKNFLSTFCGSPLYASPEIVQGKPYFGPEVDCWSLGVLLYTLVYGAMPFDGSNFKKLVKQISEGDYYEPAELSDASGLIRKMLTVAPTKRANIDDICTDEWVDTGEETTLAVVSQEFCNQMPVRLDYLLALTGNGDTALSELNEAAQDALTSTEDKISGEKENKDENELVKSADVEADSKVEEEENSKMEVDLKAKEAEEEEAESSLEKENVKKNQESVAEEKDEAVKTVEPSLKRISSFGKKSASKTSLFKSKTSSENTTTNAANKPTNGVPWKTDKLKKSGSVNEKVDKPSTVGERKPWVTPGSRVSPIKSQTAIPTSPTNKNSSLTKFNKRGSVDKSDPTTPELAKPPLRGSRVGSPTKQFQDSLATTNKASSTTPEANKTAVEANKKSPPKTAAVRQNSTREVSPSKKFGPGARGSLPADNKDSPPKRPAVPRPKSPIKTVKSNSVVAIKSSNEPNAEAQQLLPVAIKTNVGEKRGSIEIAPLQVTRKYTEEESEEKTASPQPLVSFTPKNKGGGFTLLGVKSEVSFGVDEAPQEPAPPVPVSLVVDNEKKLKEEKNDKIIKYVATIKKHGKENASTEDSPERVTLLQLKCAPSVDDMSEFGAASSVTSETASEQRGYNVYRSKYRSIHKYRSVVEHQIGSNESEEKEEEEEKLRKENKHPPEVEHSDSFSSAGSNDDLEDVFESLNSETMFTNLLSRTRNLIQRLSSGSIGINATSSGTSSFSFNSPGISLRLTTNKQSQKSSVASSSASSSNNSIASRRFGRSSSQSVQSNVEQASAHRKYLDDTSKWERRSRFDNFMASSARAPPPPEEPQRELISSFLRNRNQSLDASRRPRSYYGSMTTGCLPGMRSSRDDFTARSKDNESSIGDNNYQYSKSYSRQVSEESVESSSAKHTSTRLLNLRNPTTSFTNVPTAAGSSVTRDYSRSASQSAGKSYEEEEEIKKEHRVTEDKDVRSVITKKECVRRSVSQCESKVSNTNSNKDLSHQDSGVESMFGSASTTGGKPSPVKTDNAGEHPLLSRHHLKVNDDNEDGVHVSDSNETSSIGSDSTTNEQWAHSTSPSHISPSRCGEESVADRIRRKSFYSRFNESRSPRNKSRKQSPCLSSGIASNTHLRHLLETDPFLDSRSSSGNHFDIHPQSEFTPHHHRTPSQRWSVHLHSPTNSGYSEGISDYFNPCNSSSFSNKSSDSNSTLPRRSSFTGNEDLNGSGPSMARTHSLPEENAPPENSIPASSSSPYSSTGSLRRPRRLDLYERNIGSGLDDHFGSGRHNWRQYGSNNTLRDTLDSWEMPSFCRSNGGGGTTLSSLMDSLDSPSEVLQKAMELCDSLRKSK